MTKENSEVFLLILLGMLTAFGPFVTDMYLPSLPSMGEYFHTTSSMVQLGLTTSMIGLAVGQIFFGPLSDRYGRRLPLLVAMWLFIASTLLCLFAQNIEQFVAFRLLQGIAGAGGIVISRSVATDNFPDGNWPSMLCSRGYRFPVGRYRQYPVFYGYRVRSLCMLFDGLHPCCPRPQTDTGIFRPKQHGTETLRQRPVTLRTG